MNGIIATSDSFSLGDISRSIEFEPFKILDGLINSWCERRALRPLRYLLEVRATKSHPHFELKSTSKRGHMILGEKKVNVSADWQM
jgi:hypothetical protein